MDVFERACQAATTARKAEKPHKLTSHLDTINLYYKTVGKYMLRYYKIFRRLTERLLANLSEVAVRRSDVYILSSIYIG